MVLSGLFYTAGGNSIINLKLISYERKEKRH